MEAFARHLKTHLLSKNDSSRRCCYWKGCCRPYKSKTFQLYSWIFSEFFFKKLIKKNFSISQPLSSPKKCSKLKYEISYRSKLLKILHWVETTKSSRAGGRVEKSRRPTISEVRKKSTDQPTRFDQNWSALADHWSTITGRPKPTDQVDDHWLTTSVTQMQVDRRPEVIF